MKNPSSAPSPHARILLADDNKLGLQARKSLLEEQGYVVITAVHGRDAFERFRSEAFDLVITDYKMPGMNGLELIQEIRKCSPQIPIILISGYADALGMTEANTGADAVIAKSATEVANLMRSANRLLRPARKPPRAHAARAHVRATAR